MQVDRIIDSGHHHHPNTHVQHRVWEIEKEGRLIPSSPGSSFSTQVSPDIWGIYKWKKTDLGTGL